jgi:putative membrane-bound dehydrogenase-like protein
MSRRLLVLFCTLLFLTPRAAFAADKPRAILLTQSAGFDHEVVKRTNDQPSIVEQNFATFADKVGFTVENTRDASTLTPDKIKSAKLIVFYTTGELPMTEETFKAFDQWIKDGGSFMGIHPATDTFHKPPFHDAYNNIINGEFEDHPWHQDAVVTLKVLDDKHPATKDFPKDFTHQEEIYLQKNFDPSQVHVLLSLDMEKTALKKPKFIPIAWCKNYGKGKVFYTSLGHRPDMWSHAAYRGHVTGALKWLLDQEKADVAPNPDVSKREEDISKKAAGEEHSSLPTVPEGFSIRPFVAAPDIHSPASMCVTPDGKVFASEDEYNTGGGVAPGSSRVKLCIDTNNDGKADKITTFCEKLNSPQGMTYAGGVLYVVHAPFLTAFRDTNGDGVADTREDLVTGLGPIPEGLVHHVPSGLRMASDGYLYISIGDKGIVKATAKDGSVAADMHGGGVVRVFPDGSHLDIFSHHTRNTFDVAASPTLDLFTRDNTNDGGGWWSRVTQMQRDGEYGYPSLYMNFSDEMIPCMAEYGSGSATGSMYVAEPGFPGSYGDCLYACDWARGIVYQHDLVRKGATFSVSQNQFSKGTTPTDVDIDAAGNIYLADWGRRDWGAAGKVGAVFQIQHKNPTPLPPIPDLTSATSNDLLALIVSPSQIRRREALCELVARFSPAPPAVERAGESGKAFAAERSNIINGLTRITMKPGDLPGRISALFALARIQGDDAARSLGTFASLADIREYALRALADRDDLTRNMKPDIFVGYLKDNNPRVRTQAAIALGHMHVPTFGPALVTLTADPDVMVRHAAQQSLRRLKAIDACIAALDPKASPEIATGALRTLRTLHDPKTVQAVTAFLDKQPAPPLRQQAIKTLACLYKVEAPWDGSWWTPRPDTRGPHFKPIEWAQTKTVAARLGHAIDDPDPATAKVAIFQCGLSQIPEAVPTLSRMIVGGVALKDDAARALIDCKSESPEALSALEYVVLTPNFPGDIRNSAAQSLGAIDTAQAVIVRLLQKLDTTKDLPGGLLDKLAESLSTKAPAADNVTSVGALLRSTQPNTRNAAATSLLRSKDTTIRQRNAALFTSDDANQVESLLTALAKVPAEHVKSYRDSITVLLKDPRPPIRQAATVALGHLGDAGAVKDLLAMARRDPNPVPIVTALSEIAPNATADDQIMPIAELLVSTSVKASKSDDHTAYNKLVTAAQKFLADPRVPTTQASAMLSQLKQPGVISEYLRTESLPAKDAASAFHTAFPPEETPAGPFHPFSVGGKEIAWTPLVVKDPQGKQPLDMAPNSVMYLTATVESPAATMAQLSTGSDDGLQVWLNGKSVLAKDVDRGLVANDDKKNVPLIAGKNVFLFKVDNHSTTSGIQSRVRSRAMEFDAEEMTKLLPKITGVSPTRGRQLFESAGCIKCHTTDLHEEQKGPYLGDAGAKFPAAHLVESILRPSAKIAQGFQSERIIVKDKTGATEYAGFPVKESADDVQLRDITGKVTVIKKTTITKRIPMQGSIMPDGLAEPMTLDDFGSLLAYLTTLK